MRALVAEANNTVILLQILLGGGLVAGVGGAIVALYKLRPDINSAAVVQAQGAMDVMREVNEELGKRADYWEHRAREWEERCLRAEEALHRRTHGKEPHD